MFPYIQYEYVIPHSSAIIVLGLLDPRDYKVDTTHKYRELYLTVFYSWGLREHKQK